MIVTTWRTLRRVGLASVLLCAGCGGGSEARPEAGPRNPAESRTPGTPPQFADYPVEGEWTDEPAAPDVATNPDAQRFGPALWQGARRGPNFAGYYTIVTRRCGKLCREFVIVDVRTGRVHAGLTDTPPFRFRLNSRLIVFEGPRPLPGRTRCAGCSATYYLWSDPRLAPVPLESWLGPAEK